MFAFLMNAAGALSWMAFSLGLGSILLAHPAAPTSIRASACTDPPTCFREADQQEGDQFDDSVRALKRPGRHRPEYCEHGQLLPGTPKKRFQWDDPVFLMALAVEIWVFLFLVKGRRSSDPHSLRKQFYDCFTKDRVANQAYPRKNAHGTGIK